MGLEDKAQTRDIDGVTYKAWPLGFGIGRQAIPRLVKVMAPIVSAIMSGGANAAAMAALPQALSDEDLDWFTEHFGNSSCYENGEKWPMLVKQNREQHFAARYDAWAQWLMFCMEVNGFAGFFNGLRKGAAAAGLLQATTPKP